MQCGCGDELFQAWRDGKIGGERTCRRRGGALVGGGRPRGDGYYFGPLREVASAGSKSGVRAFTLRSASGSPTTPAPLVAAAVAPQPQNSCRSSVSGCVTRGEGTRRFPQTKIVQGAGTYVPKSHLVSEFDRFIEHLSTG